MKLTKGARVAVPARPAGLFVDIVLAARPIIELASIGGASMFHSMTSVRREGMRLSGRTTSHISLGWCSSERASER